MRPLNRILKWENARRIAVLTEFRAQLSTYDSGIKRSWMANALIESDAAKPLRVTLNRQLDLVRGILGAGGVNPIIAWSPPGGGYVRNVDVIMALFNLHTFHMSFEDTYDFLDRALGVYEHNARPALIRTWNPFWYIGVALEQIAAIPFRLLGSAGFNRARAESSLLGRLIKVLVQLVTIALGVVGLLQAFKRWPY
jgi:hypothetical protein